MRIVLDNLVRDPDPDFTETCLSQIESLIRQKHRLRESTTGHLVPPFPQDISRNLSKIRKLLYHKPDTSKESKTVAQQNQQRMPVRKRATALAALGQLQYAVKYARNKQDKVTPFVGHRDHYNQGARKLPAPPRLVEERQYHDAISPRQFQKIQKIEKVDPRLADQLFQDPELLRHISLTKEGELVFKNQEKRSKEDAKYLSRLLPTSELGGRVIIRKRHPTSESTKQKKNATGPNTSFPIHRGPCRKYLLEFSVDILLNHTNSINALKGEPKTLRKFLIITGYPHLPKVLYPHLQDRNFLVDIYIHLYNTFLKRPKDCRSYLSEFPVEVMHTHILLLASR